MKSRLIVIFVLSLFLLFVPSETVLANSPPPQSVFWFTFVYDIPDQVTIEDISLFACEDETCSASQTIAKAEAGTGSQVWLHQFYCYESWCRLRFSSRGIIDGAILDRDTNSYYFKIVVGFSDKERSSNVIKGLPKEYGSSTKYFIANVRESDLVLSVDDNFTNPRNDLGFVGHLISFFITLLAEPIFAGIFLIAIYKMKNQQALKLGLLVFLINIITYPSLWTFSWAISQLEWSSDQRFFGWLALFMSITFWTFVLLIISRKGKSRYIWMVLSPIFMILFCIMFWFISYLLISRFPLFDTVNLSYWNVIIVIEILAVIYEGILIFALGKKALSLPKALTVSFLMNLASFLIGLPVANLLG